MSGRGRTRAAESRRAPRAQSPPTALKETRSERGCRREKEETVGEPRAKSQPKRANPEEKPVRAERDERESDPGRILLETLDKLKIKKQHRAVAAATINEVVEMIERLLKETECFGQMVTLRTGSAYENVKISEPDEFDVMFAVRVERTRLQQLDDGSPFCSVHLDRERRRRPYRQFVLENGTISAGEMLKHFRERVKAAVRELSYVEVKRKKKGCPAVTLQIKKPDMEFPISLDIVLGLEVHSSSWPSFTKDGCKIEKWLGSKVKKDFKLKPFYLVSKYEGKGNEAKEGVLAKGKCSAAQNLEKREVVKLPAPPSFSHTLYTDVWRISFSHVEKDILKNHGKAKTCCEKQGVQCCRKACLKLLKHLLHILKETCPKDLSEFNSYLAKTALLHACSNKVEDNYWAATNLSHCFQMLLEDFENHLRSGSLPNFFIPSHNLLGSSYSQKNCDHLADLIAEQRNNGFPIFRSSSQSSTSQLNI